MSRVLYHCIERCFHEDCVHNGVCQLGVTIVIEQKNVDIKPDQIRREKKVKKQKTNPCLRNKVFCGNPDVCGALGFCMLEHPAIKEDKNALGALRSARSLRSVLKIFRRVIGAASSVSDGKLFIAMVRERIGTFENKGNCKGNPRSKNCTNHKVCDLLGQCMKEHPLIRDNEELKARLNGSFLSIKNCIKVFEETMPGLKRIGQRQYFKPEAKIDL